MNFDSHNATGCTGNISNYINACITFLLYAIIVIYIYLIIYAYPGLHATLFAHPLSVILFVSIEPKPFFSPRKWRGTELYYNLRLWNALLNNKVKPTSRNAGVITLYPCSVVNTGSFYNSQNEYQEKRMNYEKTSRR